MDIIEIPLHTKPSAHRILYLNTISLFASFFGILFKSKNARGHSSRSGILTRRDFDFMFQSISLVLGNYFHIIERVCERGFFLVITFNVIEYSFPPIAYRWSLTGLPQAWSVKVPLIY